MLTVLALMAGLQGGVPPIAVPAALTGAVRAMEAEGFELTDAREAAGAAGRQWAATFRKTSDRDGYREELHVYLDAPAGPRLLHRRAADTSAFALERFDDITGDGFSELVIRLTCGGTAWRCHRLGVLQVRPDEVVELTRSIRGTLFPSALADLDGDGIPELVVTDARWETYSELDHVNAPRLERVFRWNGTDYEHSSARFPQFGFDRIAEMRGRLEATSLPFDYMSAAVSLLLHYRDIGQGEEGWSEFERYVTNAPAAVVSARLWNGAKVLEDFRPSHLGVWNAAAQLDGEWRFLGRVGDGTISARLVLHQEDDSVLVTLEIDGHVLSGRGSTDGLHFNVELTHVDGRGPEHDGRLRLNGRLEGDGLAGEWNDGGASGTWTGERSDP